MGKEIVSGMLDHFIWDGKALVCCRGRDLSKESSWDLFILFKIRLHEKKTFIQGSHTRPSLGHIYPSSSEMNGRFTHTCWDNCVAPIHFIGTCAGDIPAGLCVQPTDLADPPLSSQKAASSVWHGKGFPSCFSSLMPPTSKVKHVDCKVYFQLLFYSCDTFLLRKMTCLNSGEI